MKKILILGILLSFVIFAIRWLNRNISYQLFGEIYTSIETDQKVVALTLDDGPNEKIDTILSILNHHNVKATFFPIGNLMANRLSDVKRMVRDGHEIGNHSFTHQALSFKSYETIDQEIEPTDRLIRQAGYKGVIHFRPPYGKKLFMLPLYLEQHNRKTITWNIAPEGNRMLNNDPDKLAQHVIDQARNGSIILLHPMNDGNEASLNSLDFMIRGLKEKGFKFKSVTELLALNKK